MNKLILLALVSLPAWAQTPQLSVTSSRTTGLKGGDTATITVPIGNQPAAPQITAFQFLPVLSKITLTNATIVTPVALGKQLDCNASMQCVVSGLNAVAITTGPTVTFTGTITPGSTGTATITLTGIVAADANGNGVTVTAGPTLTLSLALREDLNNDGAVDQLDAAIVRDQIQGRTPCGTADINGDGLCNVRDLNLVVHAFTP